MILAIIIFIIILYGYYKKIDVFNTFIDGSKESYTMILNLFPSLLAMLLAINIFVNSGLITDIFSNFNFKYISSDIISLMLLRPISSSSSLALLSNILESHGPDSYIGILASIIQGSTDTTIYILALYFGSVGVTKTRYALANGLLADLITYLIAIIIVNLLLF